MNMNEHPFLKGVGLGMVAGAAVLICLAGGFFRRKKAK